MPVTSTTRSAGTTTSSPPVSRSCTVTSQESPSLLEARRMLLVEAQEDRPRLAGLLVERLELAVGAHVAVKMVAAALRKLLPRLHGQVGGGAAAVARAPAVAVLDLRALAAADAVDEGDLFYLAAIVEQLLPSLLQQALELRRGSPLPAARRRIRPAWARIRRSRWSPGSPPPGCAPSPPRRPRRAGCGSPARTRRYGRSSRPARRSGTG